MKNETAQKLNPLTLSFINTTIANHNEGIELPELDIFHGLEGIKKDPTYKGIAENTAAFFWLQDEVELINDDELYEAIKSDLEATIEWLEG